jgi:hypothetical protein
VTHEQFIWFTQKIFHKDSPSLSFISCNFIQCAVTSTRVQELTLKSRKAECLHAPEKRRKGKRKEQEEEKTVLLAVCFVT